VSRVEAGTKAELERRPGPSRAPLYLSGLAVVLAAAALVLTLV
jgi:hypothetical protein